MTERRKLGTFIGVFTPTVLTILGVIMFLRMGWVVGQAGVLGAVVIVLISNAITLTTAMSMSTLATNMRVGVGGAYFLISRSLGLEVGGAIGIPLYLSQVLSVTLYAFGLAESMRIVWPGAPVAVLAAIIVAIVTALAAQSTEYTLKAQLPIMVLIAFAIGSLLLGTGIQPSLAPAFGPWTEAGFWQAFAVFFPAVTGILAGVSLSGDLEDPGTAIPTGVLAAVAVGFFVYLVVPLALAGAATPTQLAEPLVWTEIAAFGWLVMPGLWGAILSSAFGSILGAPRTLQALAEDRLVPGIFSRVDEKSGEPVLGLWVSGGIAFVAVLLGDLNAVASWVTVFFLTTYGALNGVACLETLTSDTSFRPRIRVAWWVSLLGALGCFVAMFAINPLACVVAIVVEAGIFYFLSRRSLEATWGDVRGGLFMTGARWALMNLRGMRFDPRNWRPNILVFAPDLTVHLPVVRLADFFGQHRGIVTVVTLVEADVEAHTRRRQLLEKNQEILRENGLMSAFCEVTAVPDRITGVAVVAQANGIAGLQSNTAMFQFGGTDPDELATLLAQCRQLSGLQMCTAIYVPGRASQPTRNPSRNPTRHQEVVVWWKGREHNGDLMLLLAHLLTVTSEWKGTQIVLRLVVDDAEEAAERTRELLAMIADIRMAVEVDVIVAPEGDSARDVIVRHSADATFVFLGLQEVEAGKERRLAETLIPWLEQLPSVILGEECRTVPWEARMKRKMIVMRHAKSAWDTDAPDDHARPLNQRGRSDAPRVAEALVEQGWVPQKVVSSDSMRTRETWALMAPSFSTDVVTEFTDALYHGGVGAFRDEIRRQDDGLSTVLVLGHNPGWESVVGWLCGEDVRMTTANAALLSTDAETWAEALDGEWHLHRVIRPRDL